MWVFTGCSLQCTRHVSSSSDAPQDPTRQVVVSRLSGGETAAPEKGVPCQGGSGTSPSFPCLPEFSVALSAPLYSPGPPLCPAGTGLPSAPTASASKCCCRWGPGGFSGLGPFPEGPAVTSPGWGPLCVSI